jgi:hypothetical protein
MKKIHLIPILFVGLIVACKDSSQNVMPSPPIDVVNVDAQLQAEVKNHPSINAPIVEQNKVKNIDVFLNKRMVSSIQYNYYTDGKIKDVIFGNTNPYEYEYKDGILTTNYSKKSYLLDNNGLALSIKDDAQTKFYYKDGFLLRTNITGDFKYTYSTMGNLTEASIGNESLNYEYTAYPNTIRQEILKLQEYSNSIRDFYLGRYSTNLIKEIKYNGSTVMIFEYEFDAQKRVTKVIMNRTSPSSINLSNKITIGATSIIEYNLSY